ncbi:hypothetical protein BFL38_13860 [Brachyspira hampsonii]|uniref:Uncharacterized protein n=1 Tax=Brachyspira hampsonii TaxID=1287055 RepID=A0A1E5NGT2_9SPIR|nr:hypothetical protein [Brachyspira hampsonii]OEJ15372.1 hypothetical protein BFL38_13860 [Brachyspira hampsonii]
MVKKIFLFTLLVSSFLVIGCSNKDKTGIPQLSYKPNGISSVYEGKGYKFFSMDGDTYSVTIQNGGISGLGSLSFDKSSIYSINADGDDDSTGNYKNYVVYNDFYNGIIMLSKTDNNIGNIYLTNIGGSTVSGIIDINRPERNIPTSY